ncbi:MAG: FkbM family methyltransferase [Candidatus Acidiferrales bacterium]
MKLADSEGRKNLIRAAVPRGLRNWLRSPSRSAIYLLDSATFALGARKTLQICDDGWSMACHPLAYRFAYENQISDPEQNEELRVFLSSCRKSMLLFDIGAHFGVFSLAAAHLGGNAVAVDPSPAATRIIAAQVALNGFEEEIRVLRAAASDRDGTIELLGSGAFSYGYFQVVKGRSKRDLTEARCVTIDRLTREFGEPTHIKIDVEGHEAEVLVGARTTLRRCSPVVFLELHNDMIRSGGGDSNHVLDELVGAGFKLYTLGGVGIERSCLIAWPLVRFIARRASASSPTNPLIGDI